MIHIHEEAARCLLCEDAPCTKSCKTGDVARAIRAIRFGNEKHALRFVAGCTEVDLQRAEEACIHYDRPIRIPEMLSGTIVFMKRLTSILFALVCTTGLFAQTSKLPVVKEIVSLENENTGQTVDVVNIPLDGVNRYFLHVGNMGIGDKIVQIELDPVYRLYIPLGNNITDAVAAMEELKTLYKEPKGTMREIQGSFKPFFPTEETETVQVYRHQPLLTNQLQFVIERDGYQRVAYLAKSDFNSLLRGLKFHGKLYPSEL